MIATYRTLLTERGGRSRLDQLLEWMGDDFDGV
jgi:hypothetical protein